MIQNIHISKKTFQLFCGMVLCAFVLIHEIQVTPHQANSQDQTDQTDPESESSSIIVSSQAIPNAPSQINLGFDSYLLDEKVFDEEVNDNSTSSELIIPRVHKAIKILLAKIISPNAP